MKEIEDVGTQPHFDRDFSCLFNNQRFSDVVVECGGTTWFAHKSIICTRSKWFSKAFEGDFQETSSAKVTINEMHPERVGWLLKYLYTGDHSMEGVTGFTDNPFVSSHDLTEIADFFMLGQLKTAIAGRLMNRLSGLIVTMQCYPHDWYSEDTFCEIGFESDLLQFWDNFFRGVHAMFDANHENAELRGVFTEFGVRTRPATLLDSRFVDGLRQETAFAAEVLIASNPHEDCVDDFDKIKQCSACKQKLFKNGRHIRRFQFDQKTVYECSGCDNGLE